MVYERAREYSNSLHESILRITAKIKKNKTACWECLLIITIVLGFTGILIYFLVCSGVLDDWPKFSLAVTSTKGLLPSSQSSSAISPVFNLTFHVDNSNNHHYRYCVEKGEAKVFYQLVQIAAAPTLGFCVERSEPTLGFCVKGLDKKDVTLHAWDMELLLPTFVRDQLFEEVKKSKAIFDVQLMLKVSNHLNCWLSSIDCHMVAANAVMSRCKHSASLQPNPK